MPSIHSTRAILVALALGTTALTAPTIAFAKPLGEIDRPIRLALLEWTGAQISTQVAGRVLEAAGYTVEYLPAGSFPQYSGLADGTLSATVEIWSNNVGDIYPRELEGGTIENIGPLGLETAEGWAYPRYMEEICPGLPDWTALKDPDCAMALATPDSLPNGRLLDYPADWGSRSAAIIADNALPLTAVPGGSEGAIVAELRAAVATQSPLLLMFWAPHHVLADIDLGWVEMPPCISDDPDDCVHAPVVEKVVWSGFSETWPAAYQILRDYQLSADAQAQMMAAVLEEGNAMDSVVDAWIDENQETWRPWVESALD